MCRVFRPQWGGGNCITDAGGVADISRWCKPPVTHTKFDEPRQGRRNGRRAISAAPAGARIQPSRRTGGLHHRLISNVPPGQLRSSNPRTPGYFPTRTLEMRCVLVGLRSKTALNTYQRRGFKGRCFAPVASSCPNSVWERTCPRRNAARKGEAGLSNSVSLWRGQTVPVTTNVPRWLTTSRAACPASFARRALKPRETSWFPRMRRKVDNSASPPASPYRRSN